MMYIADIPIAGVHRFMWIYYTFALWALSYINKYICSND